HGRDLCDAADWLRRLHCPQHDLLSLQHDVVPAVLRRERRLLPRGAHTLRRLTPVPFSSPGPRPVRALRRGAACLLCPALAIHWCGGGLPVARGAQGRCKFLLCCRCCQAPFPFFPSLTSLLKGCVI